MTSKSTLLGAMLLFISAQANGELAFAEHGFSIDLAEGWTIIEVSALYESYIAANEKAFGEAHANQLSRNTSIVFKASKSGLDDESALYTCVVGRNIPDLGTMTEAETTSLIEEVAGNSYRALASRGLDVTRPVLQSKNGIKYSTHGLTQSEGEREHTALYKMFIANDNLVVCAGAALSVYSEDLVFMSDSISRIRP